MILYTIGFTRKKAETFFDLLAKAGVKKVLDTRLNNASQLAGFAKKDDLAFFLKEICEIEYQHCLDLAPTQELLDRYKKEKEEWSWYEKEFLNLIRKRKIEKTYSPEELNRSCLLCSEATAKNCHRRLVAEYFQKKFPDLQIIHLE